jgi:hypothetical protein
LFFFEDIELTEQLSTLVSEALLCIRGNVKAKVSVAKNTSQNNTKLRLIQLMSSIIKRTSIIDTTRSLAHGCLEVDASHWNRLMFFWYGIVHSWLPVLTMRLYWQWRCLRIFLIGTGNYKTIPLQDIYSPSLHQDLHVKVGDALGINVGLDDFDSDPIAWEALKVA